MDYSISLNKEVGTWIAEHLALKSGIRVASGQIAQQNFSAQSCPNAKN
jgi:hypothetical protein